MLGINHVEITNHIRMGNHMNWRNKTIGIGAAIGLIIGLAGAYIVIQRAERNNMLPEISAGDGLKVGLGLLGVLRLVADIADQG
jgi:drug/metabolite transporter (DMT)-like permease